ncbi:MAG: RimK family alpha-L-glutamate ligase [Spirochaetes bacterium]|nr:RimK family alpha-L-glutamate ligase [Spirochaetota bacterium]MBX3723377.1 RimK family alpha-L-glutamate ligase [Turneriella sp.]
MPLESRPNANPLTIHILSNARSLYSTRRFFEEGFKRGHKMRVYPPMQMSAYLERNALELYYTDQKIETPHCIIPRLGQKKPEHTLAIIRHYEMMHVKSLNASHPMTRCRDKFVTMQILAQNKIAVPRSVLVDDPLHIDTAFEKIGEPPYILKIPTGSQGTGVMIADSKTAARSFIETLLDQGVQIIVQEFIAEAKGADYRAIILNGNLIAAMRRQATGYDFRSNIHRGAVSEKVELSIEATRTVKLAARILGLTFAGVDLIESKRGPMVLEVNASPGLEGIEGASSVNIAEKVIQHLEDLPR